MPDIQTIRRALISVSDKRGVVELATALHDRGIELISTGGTAAALEAAGLPVTAVESLTGVPEMLDGRVKTLHPAIHAPVLADRSKGEHMATLEELGHAPIDLVVVNLYPFEDAIADARDAGEAEIESIAVENIDVGGPTLLRAAAKNFDAVTVACSPESYTALLDEMHANDGGTTRRFRRRLAADAFARLAAYNAAIGDFLWTAVDQDSDAGADEPNTMPSAITLHATRVRTLRYGENPHQKAALYRIAGDTSASIAEAEQIAGKPLSYNNINDAAAALSIAVGLNRFAPDRPGATVIKHTNPCGMAVAADASTAVIAAVAGDPLAAFGGVLACTSLMDHHAAAALAEHASFLELVIAPSFDDSAAEVISERWPNCRLVEIGDIVNTTTAPLHIRAVPGGLLVQTPDEFMTAASEWTHAAGPDPDENELLAAELANIAAKHLTSNAIAIAGDINADRLGDLTVAIPGLRDLPDNAPPPGVMLVGAGAGQMDRVAAARIAADKAGTRARNAAAASDAFFPFPDAPKLLIDAGVNTIVHPGGSKRDDDTFKLCDERYTTCLITNTRHFRH